MCTLRDVDQSFILIDTIMFIKVSALILLVVSIHCLIYPPPVHEEYQAQYLTLKGVCNLFQMPTQHQLIDSQYYLNKILKRLNGNSLCQRPLTYSSTLHTLLTAAKSSQIKAEGYVININEEGIKIQYSDYSGYVYALESLSQIIKDNKVQYGVIKDEPLLQYRGIMIDSARHYLGVAAIKRLVQAMPLSKLNILHWHLIDDESFPVELGSHPELAQAGRFSAKQTYTIDQIKQIIKLADLNAVKIIPQVDTPAHVRVWGLAPEWKNKNITIKCAGGTGYNGQFDVSKSQVFDLAKDVVREIDDIFKNSPYIHLGGDEVSSACWNLRPQIQNFMKLKNIKTYGELQMYWRFQLKQVLPANRKVIFWRNDGQNVTTSDNDILHFWGAQTDVAKITANTTSKIILSPSDILYLSKGQGNLWLNATQGTYPVWRQIYEKFIVFPAGVDKSRILGGQVCLWGEVSNQDTLQNNLWMRSSAFAAKVWSQKTLLTHQLVASLVQIQRSLYALEVGASPITSEFCEYKPQVCFPPGQGQIERSQPQIVEQ